MEVVTCVFCHIDYDIEDVYECEGVCGSYLCDSCVNKDASYKPELDNSTSYSWCGASDCADSIQDYHNDKYV